MSPKRKASRNILSAQKKKPRASSNVTGSSGDEPNVQPATGDDDLRIPMRFLHPTGGVLPFSAKKSSVKVIVACFKLHNKCIASELPIPYDDIPEEVGQENFMGFQTMPDKKVNSS